MEGERQPLLRRQSEESAASTIAPRWKTTALALYFTLVVCQGGAQFGFLIVFSSPLLDDFQVKLPYNFTVWSGFNECAYQDLVGPMGPVGAVFGSILSSPVVAVTGYVTGMVVMSGLSLVGWLLIAVSYFTYYGGAGSPACFRALLFLGRFLTGVGAGWAAGVVLVYIGEVSPPAIRGKLVALFELVLCVGVLLVYLLGAYISYWKLAFVCTAISVVQLVLMFTIHESPRLSRNPLKNFRTRFGRRQSDLGEETCNNDMPVASLNTGIKSQPRSSAKSNFLRIVIVVILLVFQAITGVDAIISLAGPIFRAAKLDSPTVSSGVLASLTVGVVLTLFTALSLFVVDRFGRRIPLFFGGIALTVADLGMVVYFSDVFGFIPNPNSGNSSMNASIIQNCVSEHLALSKLASELSALPIASVCLFFAAFSLAWGTVPWVIAGELFPDQIRELGMGISSAMTWICIAMMMSGFPLISEVVGQAVPFLILAVISLLSSIFVVFFLAETKGLTLEQISSMEVTNVKKNVKEFGLLLGWLLRCGFVRKIDLPHYQG